jgi:hypothetical protein
MSLRLASPAVAAPEALPEIVALLERVFPRDRPWAPDLEWQYLRNPWGPARYINAYADSGALIAHYGLLPAPPLAEPPVALAGTFLSLNVAADPSATVPGLMVATTRALYRALPSDGPTLVVGITNENSAMGFVRVLGFRSLGRLSLTVHAPGTWPVLHAPRALAANAAHLAWRASRPGVATHGDVRAGGLTVRLHHRGLPLDAVLSAGLENDAVARLSLPRSSRLVPRLYAAFGARVRGGLAVPERLRPSPLEYVCRVFGDASLTEVLSRHLQTRRFEFLDFDVV